MIINLPSDINKENSLVLMRKPSKMRKKYYLKITCISVSIIIIIVIIVIYKFIFKIKFIILLFCRF